MNKVCLGMIFCVAPFFYAPMATAQDTETKPEKKTEKPADKQTPKTPAQFKAELLKKYDANGNGKLDKEEMLKAQKEAILKRFDADGDGKLNDEEKAAFEKARAKAKRVMRIKMTKEDLKKYDVDKDGKLSNEEKKKLIEDIKKRIMQQNQLNKERKDVEQGSKSEV